MMIAEKDLRAISTEQDNEPDWAQIAHAYATRPERLSDIAARFGVSRQRIQARARREGWQRAPALDAAVLAKAEETQGPARRRIMARLFKALDEQMMQIEKRIADGATRPQSAADAERDARALSALAGLYAKLVALDEAAKEAAGDQGEQTGRGRMSEAGRDADRLREELARRLQRLNQAPEA